VLILEEINELTDGHTSEHSDTKYTAMQLWTLLDSYCKDKNFLLIGTTSETKKMSPQLQSRFKGRTFVMDSLSSEARKRTIEFVFKKIGIEKDETCDEAYLIDLAQKIAHFSQRDIEALIQTSLLLSVTHNSQALTRVATKECLELAYAQIVQENEKLWDFSEHTTDEERRHR
jgi:SpoVK/Ycf46/Vps4 family AAA+-type ATPase